MAAREKPGAPMTLSSMRKNGVRAMIATCQTCEHKADVNVDALPETVIVPHAGRRLRCSQCGGKRIETHLAYDVIGYVAALDLLYSRAVSWTKSWMLSGHARG